MSTNPLMEALAPKCWFCDKPSHDCYCSVKCWKEHREYLRDLTRFEEAGGCFEPGEADECK